MVHHSEFFWENVTTFCFTRMNLAEGVGKIITRSSSKGKLGFTDRMEGRKGCKVK